MSAVSISATLPVKACPRSERMESVNSVCRGVYVGVDIERSPMASGEKRGRRERR